MNPLAACTPETSPTHPPAVRTESMKIVQKTATFHFQSYVRSKPSQTRRKNPRIFACNCASSIQQVSTSHFIFPAGPAGHQQLQRNNHLASWEYSQTPQASNSLSPAHGIRAGNPVGSLQKHWWCHCYLEVTRTGSHDFWPHARSASAWHSQCLDLVHKGH